MMAWRRWRISRSKGLELRLEPLTLGVLIAAAERIRDALSEKDERRKLDDLVLIESIDPLELDVKTQVALLDILLVSPPKRYRSEGAVRALMTSTWSIFTLELERAATRALEATRRLEDHLGEYPERHGSSLIWRLLAQLDPDDAHTLLCWPLERALAWLACRGVIVSYEQSELYHRKRLQAWHHN